MAFDINTKTTDYANLILTHQCNRKCPFCVDCYRGEQGYISLDSVKKGLDACREKGITTILLIGGEPTLHPHVITIAKMIKDQGFSSVITTNYGCPEVVAKLDGIVDNMNISYYGQKVLPFSGMFLSDLTLHTLIHSEMLPSKLELDEFITKHEAVGWDNLKFSTLFPCNEWSKIKGSVDYLDTLECKWGVAFNEILVQEYRGVIIKRYDRIINHNAVQSLKIHVDGTINHSWIRGK